MHPDMMPRPPVSLPNIYWGLGSLPVLYVSYLLAGLLGALILVTRHNKAD